MSMMIKSNKSIVSDILSMDSSGVISTDNYENTFSHNELIGISRGVDGKLNKEEIIEYFYNHYYREMPVYTYTKINSYITAYVPYNNKELFYRLNDAVFHALSGYPDEYSKVAKLCTGDKRTLISVLYDKIIGRKDESK